MLRRYTWGLDVRQSLEAAGGIGGLLSLRDWNGTADPADDRDYAYFHDGLGNVRQLIDVTLVPAGQPNAGQPTAAYGTIAAQYEYDSFGRLVSAVGPNGPGGYHLATQQLFRFSTKYFDAETGLYYYGYRYYSPRLGRWLNRDPLGEAGLALVFVGGGSRTSKAFENFAFRPSAEPRFAACECRSQPCRTTVRHCHDRTRASRAVAARRRGRRGCGRRAAGGVSPDPAREGGRAVAAGCAVAD